MLSRGKNLGFRGEGNGFREQVLGVELTDEA